MQFLNIQGLFFSSTFWQENDIEMYVHVCNCLKFAIIEKDCSILGIEHL